ncbi:MAG: hypothetical protein ACREVN_06710, partial [Gammaproteobacteria bacterium]
MPYTTRSTGSPRRGRARLLFVSACLAISACLSCPTQAAEFSGLSLSDALAELEAQGLRLI